jgi:hypothetical protein
VYRIAPRNALYQGDIVVVPAVTLERDPKILSREKKELECGRCGQPIRSCSDPGCLAPLPKPTKHIRSAAVTHRAQAGEQPFALGKAEATAIVRSVPVMLMSHSCDIDRQQDVCCAPVRMAADFKPEFLAAIESGKVFAFMPLPAHVRFDRAVVDLNAVFSVPAWWLGESTTFPSTMKGRAESALIPFAETIEQRLASVDNDGLAALYKARLAHEIRKRVDKLPVAIDVTAEDDPDRPSPEPLPRRPWSLPFPAGTKAAAT